MEDNDKPFECSEPGCGQSFTNEDHLAVHMRKHEMHLALNLGGPVHPGSGKSPLSGLTGLNFVDQTPTPTKFLKNCEEIGLFQELKNPFEEAFKKALDAPENATDGASSPFPGPGSNELNTPVPPIPKTIDDIRSSPGKHVNDSTKSDLLNLVRKRKESSLISSSSDKLSLTPSAAKEPKLNKNEKTSTPPQVSTSLSSTKSPILVTAAQSTTTPPPKTTVSSASLNFPPSNEMPTLPLGLLSSTPQIAMQVYLQLPTGQTIPVQIPAAINPQAPVCEFETLPDMDRINPAYKCGLSFNKQSIAFRVRGTGQAKVCLVGRSGEFFRLMFEGDPALSNSLELSCWGKRLPTSQWTSSCEIETLPYASVIYPYHSRCGLSFNKQLLAFRVRGTGQAKVTIIGRSGAHLSLRFLNVSGLSNYMDLSCYKGRLDFVYTASVRGRVFDPYTWNYYWVALSYFENGTVKVKVGQDVMPGCNKILDRYCETHSSLDYVYVGHTGGHTQSAQWTFYGDN
ncbi:hypothetical protein FSP39_011879 [Pinctada imbricata]|uniref:C2H2-type domain-containing protein n=1 Tax=Pinctada imbricata TaxID=66713 RepID=A0AA88YIZ3_PINIB|nr:hypothetical protein FSP39_011879 [Pinctada imbricata]